MSAGQVQAPSLVRSAARRRLPSPKVSQPSAGQVPSPTVRTTRLTGSLTAAEDAMTTAARAASGPASPVARASISAQVTLWVASTTTGARSASGARPGSAVRAALGEAGGVPGPVGVPGPANAVPAMASTIPRTVSSTRAPTTARRRARRRRRRGEWLIGSAYAGRSQTCRRRQEWAIPRAPASPWACLSSRPPPAGSP